MAKAFMTDLEVEAEIERLRNSPLVKLARREQYIRNRQKQCMYMLRCLEKKGQALAEQGVTMESLEILAAELDSNEE